MQIVPTEELTLESTIILRDDRKVGHTGQKSAARTSQSRSQEGS